jgi:hypothetical protein
MALTLCNKFSPVAARTDISDGAMGRADMVRFRVRVLVLVLELWRASSEGLPRRQELHRRPED